MVIMNNYVWVFQKKDERNLWWAFACSLGLHVLLFAVLIVKPFYPIVESFDKFDSIWLYPAQTVQGGPETNAGPAIKQSVEVPEKEDVAQSVEARKTVVAEEHYQPEAKNVAREEPETVPITQSEPVTEMVTARAVRIREEKPPQNEIEKERPVPAKPVEKLMDDGSGMSLNQRDLPKAAAVNESDNVKKTEASKPEKPLREEEVKENVANAERATKPVPSAKTDIRLPGTAGAIQNVATSAGKASMLTVRRNDAGKIQVSSRNSAVAEVPGQPGGKSDNNAVSSKKVAGGMSASLRVAAESPSRSGGIGSLEKSGGQPQVKPGAEPSRSQGNGKTEQSEGRAGPRSVAEQPKSKNEVVGKNPVIQPKSGVPAQEGKIALLPLTGDLKLEITGHADPIVTVSFKEYLKSHRNRPITRAEAGRVQNVKPATRMTGDVYEAVVGTAGEGIYDLIVAPGNGTTFTASFRVKIYENRSNAKTRPLGKKTLSGRTLIARILMPEGIFWDDEGSFSGYIEDSDSITKYNSDTGLVWKEYKGTED